MVVFRATAVALLPVILAVSAAMPFAAPAAAAAIPIAAAPSDLQDPLPSPGKAGPNARAAAQAKVNAALRAAAKDATSAGAYFDGTDVAVFLTTGDPAKARGKLARLVPGDAKVRFERVKHSQKDLETVQQRINADLGAGRLEGRGIVSTAIDTRANTVVVGASQVDDQLRSALVRAYGDSVVVVFEGPSQGGDAGCVSRTDCGPAKGGIRIVRTAGGYCTSGPMVRVLGSNALRILTAGHCLALTGGTGTSKTWTHSGSGLGWSEFHTWGNGADADVGLVNP
ncbi:MAG TPA: hypothetical protein VIF63_09900, partial [Candidatus Limnocylindrales bacterium]